MKAPAALTQLNPGWRGIGVTVVLLAGLAVFAWVVDGHYPIREWLFWRYAGYWLCAVAFLASAFVAGSGVLLKVLRTSLPLREHCVFSIALGVIVFFLVWFLVGLLGLYGTAAFFLVPLGLLLAGAAPTLRWAKRAFRHLGRTTRARHPASWLRLLLFGLGVVSLALVYLPILTPANIAYDARWYHLAIAEHYVADGGIRPFAEGWFLGAYPQLATVLYSWAFAFPAGRLFDRIELAAHLEFVLFLATLFSVPSLVRRLGSRRGAEISWVAVFAFPELFIYDSGLSGGADHIAALWAVPVFLALLRAWRALELRACLLLAACVSGALLTKYSALGMVIFPALAIAVRPFMPWKMPAPRPRLPARLALAGATVIAALVLTAPHWLKNLAWYGNPVFPFANGLFASRPWTVDTLDRFGHFTPAGWSAEHSWAGVAATLESLYQFSFVPNDWQTFHGVVPVFGSLFTLAIPLLFFLRRPWRLVALFVCTHLAIATWYWTFHQDRYLQTYLPWMAAGLAGIAIQVWRLGWLSRIALVALGAFQLVWGADVPFFSGHAMIGGGSALKASLDFLGSGHRQDYVGRFDTGAPHTQLAAVLPKGSKLLLHEEHLHLGVGVPTVSDWIGWQGGISYGRNPAPHQMYESLKQLGVTHLSWPAGSSRGYDSLAGDIAFHLFATHYGREPRRFGNLVLSAMPLDRPPERDFRDAALVLGCNQTYRDGLYRVSDLVTTVLAVPRPASDYPPPRSPLDPARLEEMLGQVDAVVLNEACHQAPLVARGFTLAARRGNDAIWLAPPRTR